MNVFPYDSRIDFLRLRHFALAISVILLVATVALLATRGLHYALDFTGGTVAGLRFEKPVDLDEARESLEAAGYSGAVVQAFGSETDIVIRLQPQDGQANAAQTGGAVLETIAKPDNPGLVVRSDFVGPQVGAELAY